MVEDLAAARGVFVRAAHTVALRLFASVALLLVAGWVQPCNAKDSDSNNILWSVDWSADGKFFAVGGAWVGIFDAETQVKQRSPGLDSLKAIAKIRWHPRRNLLALSGGEDGITAIYDPKTDQKITLKTKEGTRGIAWNASGDLLATAGNRGELQIWNASGELLHTTRPENAKSLTGVAWHPTEDKIITVSEFIRLYDAKGNIIKQVRHRPDAKGMALLLCVEWHPSGKLFVVGDYGNAEAGDAPVLQFWSADCKLLKTIEVKDGAAFRNVSWNRDGSLLASASDALRIWSKEGELLHVGKSPDLLWGVRWNRDGNRLLTSSHDGRVTLRTAKAEVSKNIIEAPSGALCLKPQTP
jgi:WD40 repeat protein